MKLLVYAFAAAGLGLWLLLRRKPREPIACLGPSREQVLTYVPKAFKSN